jgi:hypothetical protein
MIADKLLRKLESKVVVPICRLVVSKLSKSARAAVIYPTPRGNLSPEASIIRQDGFYQGSLVEDPCFTALNNIKDKLLPLVSSTDIATLRKLGVAEKSSNSLYMTHLTELVKKEDLLILAHSPLVFSIASSYFGFTPTVRSAEIWFTHCSPRKHPMGTQLFHRDGDDSHLLKCFIPLHRITNVNGPFEYLVKSLHSYSSNEPLRDGTCADELRNQIVAEDFLCFRFMATFGEFLLADTHGLHRGAPVEQGYRLMVIISYTSPIPSVPVLPILC